MKYVITRTKIPIIFDEALKHLDVARGFDIISAGFVNIRVGYNDEVEAVAYGESLSLGLKSRKEDSEIITRSINYK